MIHFSTLALVLQQKIQSVLGKKEIKSTLTQLVTRKQLQALLNKAIKIKDKQKQKELEAQMAQIDAWYKDFDKHLKIEKHELKEKVYSDYESLKNKYDMLMARKDEMRMKIGDYDVRYINRMQNVIQVVTDSETILLPFVPES